MKKIIFTNFCIFLLLIIIIECIFGYWFDKENFGYLMRKNRNQIDDYQTKFNGKIYTHRYKRNFYGFRGEEINPKDVEIVFLGGSTGNQRFTPEEFTIVGRLNLLLKQNKSDKVIYNGSTDGKSTFGMMNDFKFWFSKIDNFNPKLFIFYIGLNDKFYRGNCKLNNNKHFDYNDCMISVKLKDRVIDYIKNNSITYYLTKRVKHQYFPENKIRYNFFGYKTSGDQDLYENFNYLNYFEAKKIYKNIKKTADDNFIANELRKRMQMLLNYSNKYNATAVFITQIQFDGVRDLNLFKANETIKDFCRKKGVNLIALDEIIEMKKGDFYDPWHTTLKGSERITNVIFPKLNNIILNKIN